MKWQIISVGKPALKWAQAGLEDYAKRLTRMAQVEPIILKNGTPAQIAPQMLEASRGTWRIVLDEHGRDLTSMEFSQWIHRQENASLKRVSILIGGADGHDASIKKAADETWRLSTMTLQHEMALVLFYEQLYRAYGLLRGDPYHRP